MRQASLQIPLDGHGAQAKPVWVQIEQDVSTGSTYLWLAQGHDLKIFPDCPE
jgi:hypothetical protein